MKGTITDDLALDYLKNSFTSEDIDEFQNISAKYGFSLFAHEQASIHQWPRNLVSADCSDSFARSYAKHRLRVGNKCTL